MSVRARIVTNPAVGEELQWLTVEHAWWSTRAGELCVDVEAAPEAFGLPRRPPARAVAPAVPRRVARVLRHAVAA